MNDSLLRNAFQLHRSGRLEDAARLYGEILAAEPAHCDALYLLGVTHFQGGDFAAALACYDRALVLHAGRADIQAARGAALSSLQRHDEALAAYDDALARDPQAAVAWNHRGNALLELKREAEALASYDRALALKPDYAEAWRHRAVTLTQLGRVEAAHDSLSRALQRAPGDRDALQERAGVLMQLGRHDEAIADYSAALTGDPADAYLLYRRCHALSIAKRYPDAIRDCETLLSIAPEYPYARGVLAHCKLQCCDWIGLDAEKTKIADGIAAGARVISPFNHKALSDSPAEHLRCARVWVANECPRGDPLWRGERYGHARIRLAYVSGDFNNNANAALMAGVYEHHDRKGFETIAISIGSNAAPTPMRQRLEAGFDRFLDMREKSPSEIAAAMRGLEIDIAIDLMGFTGECRPGIFAARPAPIQVNYLGFPGTMGADYIDYLIADAVLVPESDAAHYSEKIVRLPDTYQANDAKRVRGDRVFRRAELGLPEEAFVFCGFHNAFKIAPAAFDSWMRLLGAVPGSVLWLLEDNSFMPPHLRREAERRGIAPERLIFAPRVGMDDHLARQRLADLFLDAFPYNAHTTTSDALWVGLPVLTMMGKSFASRVAASLLGAHGVPELVTHTPDAYEAAALALARAPEVLALLRRKIVQSRAASPLFDTARFTRHLETAYRGMMDRHAHGQPPASFAVMASP